MFAKTKIVLCLATFCLAACSQSPLSSSSSESSFLALEAPTSSSSEKSDIADPTEYEASFEDGSTHRFVSSDLDPAAYFQNNYKEFEKIEISVEPDFSGGSMFPIRSFSFELEQVPLSFEMSAYRLYDTFENEISAPDSFLLERDGFKAIAQTGWKYDLNHHRTMYLYCLSNGTTHYYLGVYRGGSYVSPNVFENLRIEATSIESIIFDWEKAINQMGESKVSKDTKTITDSETKERYSSLFVDPVIIDSNAYVAFQEQDGYEKGTITINKTDGSSESFVYHPTTGAFHYQEKRYYFSDPMNAFFRSLQGMLNTN